MPSFLLTCLTPWGKVHITVEELKAFLGFCVLMRINSLPALKDYWKRDPAFHYVPIAGLFFGDISLSPFRG